MQEKLIIVINNIPEVEYDRNKSLTGDQLDSLERMDEKMRTGIPINNEMIGNPDTKQRAHFVASQLMNALQTENNAAIASCTAYLATRLPNVRQVRINSRENGLEIDFNYSDVNAGATPIQMPGKLN